MDRRTPGIEQREIGAEEIVERCIYALVNEGARILEEGLRFARVDIDIVYVYGYGFPAYRGGPMCYADTIGLKNVYERIRQFQARHGELWTPAPLLKRLAEEGETFAQYSKEQTANRDAVIVASSRTPLAKSFRGSFDPRRAPDDLAAHCIRDMLRKTPPSSTLPRGVILGCCGQPHGVQGHNIARVSAMVPAGRPPYQEPRSTGSAPPGCDPETAAHQAELGRKQWMRSSLAASKASP